MTGRGMYTIEEDVCLAESLLAQKLIFKGPRLRRLGTRLSSVYNHFKRKTAAFGIDGRQRTLRSIEGRVYFLRNAVRQGRIHHDMDNRNSLARKRAILWLVVFGVLSPATLTKSSATVSAKALQHLERNESKLRASMDQDAILRRESVHRGIQKQKQKHLNAKRLLQSLNSVQKLRNEIKLRREKNLTRLQENDQTEHKWNIEMFKRILETAPENDEAHCAHFLKTLEDIAESDAKLCMLREGNVQDRIENDREYSEWERSIFEELMKKYFD